MTSPELISDLQTVMLRAVERIAELEGTLAALEDECATLRKLHMSATRERIELRAEIARRDALLAGRMGA